MVFDTDLPFPGTGAAVLTPREIQVLQLILEGLTNKEVGRELGISHRTVDTHREHCRIKLGAKTTAQLVKSAIGLDLQSSSPVGRSVADKDERRYSQAWKPRMRQVRR
jgi:DNA-binding CsgD family transcriptional regulator